MTGTCCIALNPGLVIVKSKEADPDASVKATVISTKLVPVVATVVVLLPVWIKGVELVLYKLFTLSTRSLNCFPKT